jgi:hypothetical protein
MENQFLRLTLEPLFSFGSKRVKVWREAAPDAQRELVATVELNHHIEMADGARYTIQHIGASWAPDCALWVGESPTPIEPPIAIYRHERIGALRLRFLVESSSNQRRVYELRRRSSWGAQANVDVVLESPETSSPRATELVLLRVERIGHWRRSLRAEAPNPGAEPLLFWVFILSLLAARERAAASSSG